jgi:hypothetical protein
MLRMLRFLEEGEAWAQIRPPAGAG